MEVSEKPLILIRSRVNTTLRLPAKQRIIFICCYLKVYKLILVFVAQFTITKGKNETVFQSAGTLQLGEHKYG